MNSQKFECELSDKQIIEQIEMFAAMAVVLQTDSDLRLEYGNPNDRPGGFLSFIRVSHIPTAGGPLYRMCSIHMGTETGGYYVTDIQELKRKIEKQIRYVHRLSNNLKIRELLAKMRANRPKLSWYFFNVMDDNIAPPLAGMLNSRNDERIFGNAVTVELKSAVAFK